MAKRGRPPGRTAQGEQTEQALYEAAIAQFAEHGYDGATMRGIADAAGVSPGLLYRYFPSKAAVVLALYEQLSTQFAATELPEGSWGERSTVALEASLATLAPHRTTLRAVLGVMLADPDTGLFSEKGAVARQRVQGVFLDAVRGSARPPQGDLADVLGRLMDLLQLGVIQFWLLDRSPDQRATKGLVAMLAKGQTAVGAALWIPGVPDAMRTFDGLAAAAFYGAAEGG